MWFWLQGASEYLVRWKVLNVQACVHSSKYDKLMLQVHVACENTWEPLTTILTARHLVDSFNSKSANT